VSGKVVPLRKPQPASPDLAEPWVRGEICRRDGIDYELIAVGEIESIEISRSKKHGQKTSSRVLDLLTNAGAQVGDHILLLRPIRSTQ
jgi:hypothetical protein